jgi:hypothetical protein
VLAWFALFVGIGIASALFKPQSVELLCSATGSVKLLVKTADGKQQAPGSHTLDCPLCASIAAPPVEQAHASHAIQPQRYASLSNPSAQVRAPAFAPLPARGPPLLLT